MTDTQKSMNPNASTDATLISQLRECAGSLPSQANEVAAELIKFADAIESPATRQNALQQFDEYAWHYKGLRDRIVPGVQQTDWTNKVATLRVSARAAVKAHKPSTWWGRLFK